MLLERGEEPHPSLASSSSSTTLLLSPSLLPSGTWWVKTRCLLLPSPHPLKAYVKIDDKQGHRLKHNSKHDVFSSFIFGYNQIKVLVPRTFSVLTSLSRFSHAFLSCLFPLREPTKNRPSYYQTDWKSQTFESQFAEWTFSLTDNSVNLFVYLLPEGTLSLPTVTVLIRRIKS